LINGYGPTENTTFTCCYTFPSDPPVNASAPIGRPIANSQVYLLDKALQPVPIGVPGELYAGGDGVAQGYLNRPELTAERFIANPFGDPARGDKLYKTGDLARWLPNGVIEFLGRLDQQVKIRGFRVEPGEIEAILTQHPVVQSAAVVAQPAGNDKQLVAYLVVAEEAAAPSLTDTLRAFLQTRLPPYMLPSRFFYLDALPLTTNGKVDRRALPLLAPEAAATDSADQSPQTPTEELLAAIWRNLLADQPVGRQSDFFASGGHSLLATQVVARVADTFGIAMGVRTLFEAPTLAAFAAVIDQRRRMGQAGLVLPPLLPSHTQPTPLPLSFAQQRLWFLEQLEGASGLYNIPLALRLHGALDERALHCALQQIVQRHAILRTTFPATDGVAAQVIAPTLDLPCPRLVIEGAGAAAEAALHQALQAELWRPFDLATGPLLRAALYALTPTEHLLALTFHHVIADGWSLAIFLDELAACYAAACGQSAAPLAPLPVQYADFTLWQRDWLRGETLAQQQAYWRQQLAHAPSLLTLPTDALRPAVQSYRGGAVTQALPPALTAGLQELSQREGVSLFMTCYAAWAVLLARYSGQEDLVIGAPIANRQQQALEPLIGFFVNTLPLRADLTGNPPFRGLLQRVRRLTLDAYAHQDIPFEQVVSDLGLPRTLSHAPLFQVMLAFNNAQPLRRTLADLTVTPVALAAVLPAVMARFDLTLHIERTADGWQATWEYNRDLFTSATIERMAGHFQTLLAAIVAAPATPIQQLPLLTPAEQHQLLMAWNPPPTPYPQDQTIHALFAAQAARTPTAPAVIVDFRFWILDFGLTGASHRIQNLLTYSDLDAYANQLAHYLRQQGVGPGALVGLCLERSPALLVGILGILKAGGAYVPLDPAYPLERLHFVCADTGMRVVVTEQALGDRFAQGDLGDLGNLQVIALDRDWALISQADRCAPVTSVQPTDLAYVIYTSGSTGQPKGVMVTHRNLVHSTTARFRYYAQPVARFLLLSSFAFDSSVAGIFWTLCQGGALVLPRPDDEKDLAGLARLISDHGVTHLLALPSLYSLLLTYSDRAHLRSLQVAIVAGEACPPALPAQHSSTLPAATLYNEYGPTEGTVWSSVYRFPPTWQGAAVPISSLPQDALPNIQLYVLDHHQQPVPIGVPGELYIGGAGITPGYWQQPALTAEKFMADPFHLADPTARLYRTGDLVRYRADGHLDFLGRIDQQVKVRGFRIELGEIEAALRQHPAIQTAAVVVWQEQLVAYVVGAGEAERQGDKKRGSRGVVVFRSSRFRV
jgi:amino acid adenylation domain-containing protein